MRYKTQKMMECDQKISKCIEIANFLVKYKSQSFSRFQNMKEAVITEWILVGNINFVALIS